MHRMPASILAAAAILAATAAGCGSNPSASPQRHTSTHQSQTKSTQKAQSTQSSSGSGSAQGSTTQPAAGSATSTGPAVTFTMMPGGTAQAPAANLGISGLPKGWQLTSMALVGPNGLSVSNTVQEAMTGTFPQGRGAFSMGADGQIITFFFPSPAGSWAGQPVRFVFTFRTASGKVQAASSSTFTFPK